MSISNPKLATYNFLEGMYEDDWFPNNLVDKGKNILIRLCEEIEDKKPQTLEELYQLTHQSTEEFNDLESEFDEAGSEIETVAREIIGENFAFIAEAYGFEADDEELIATRDW